MKKIPDSARNHEGATGVRGLPTLTTREHGRLESPQMTNGTPDSLLDHPICPSIGPDQSPERPPKWVGMLVIAMAFSSFGCEPLGSCMFQDKFPQYRVNIFVHRSIVYASIPFGSLYMRALLKKMRMFPALWELLWPGVTPRSLPSGFPER